ncbi:MAG: serine/threonine-protein phosphatase [Anaerolineae bacterium]|nr:serine/threonine-protein phosphatase [Anaerolineae bacterium]
MKSLKAWLRQFICDDVQVSADTSSALESTLPLPAKEPVDSAPIVRVQPGIFDAGWQTDPGQVRANNEDAIFVFFGEQEGSDAVPSFGLFILADGMGGHQSGELASTQAIRVSAGHLIQEIYLSILNSMERGAEQPPLNQVVREAILKANRVVTQTLPGSGTTLTCGMILGDRLFMGHVGDSRAYLIRDGEETRQLTYDHSLVHRLVDMGQLTPDEAAVHPQRNVLYRAIGQGGNLEVDVTSILLLPGDKLLFCSDGLWGMIPESEMWQIIADSPSAQSACLALVNSANVAGGNDNISVILVEVLQAIKK